ncbi:MAG: hypothetical protein GTO18_00670 [Anaerolineales bacterium]|nr:hypothetical protein [Anaerolineales bacterium]
MQEDVLLHKEYSIIYLQITELAPMLNGYKDLLFLQAMLTAINHRASVVHLCMQNWLSNEYLLL